MELETNTVKCEYLEWERLCFMPRELQCETCDFETKSPEENRFGGKQFACLKTADRFLVFNTQSPVEVVSGGRKGHHITSESLIHCSHSAVSWAVSQHLDTSKNAKAAFTFCYALHVGTVFGRDKLFAQQTPTLQ